MDLQSTLHQGERWCISKFHYVTELFVKKWADRFSEPSSSVAFCSISLNPWNHQGPAGDRRSSTSMCTRHTVHPVHKANCLASWPRIPNPFMKIPGKADLLYSENEVEAAIARMAHDIAVDLMDSNPVFLPVMNGGLVIGGKLLTRLNFPLEVSYVHATRYRNTTSGQGLEWKVKPQIDFTGRPAGRPVVIVDDILDEGHTLCEIIDYCKAEGASEVYTVVLTDKKHDRKGRLRST